MITKYLCYLDSVAPPLKAFCAQLKGIQLPSYYTKKAAELKISAMMPVKSLEDLA